MPALVFGNAALYDAEKPVAERSEAELKRAAAEAMAEVLIRVSGQQGVVQHPRLRAALDEARSYLRTFRFERRSLKDEAAGNSGVDGEAVSGNPEMDEPAGGGDIETETVLLVSFIPSRITGLLQEVGLPVWTDKRPEVLMWLSVDQDGSRQFVSRASHPKLVERLEAQAERRGISYRFPILDLRDSSALSPAQVWRLDTIAVRSASRRYKSKHVVVGRMSALSGERWLGDWVYLAGGKRELISEGTGVDQLDFGRKVADAVAGAMAETYAIRGSGLGASTITVHLSGIEDFASYADAVSYLEGLAAVEHANVQWQAGENILLSLQLRTAAERLQDYLALDNRLLESEEERNFYQGPATIIPSRFYRWQAP